jgi:hypothetical protein
MSFRKTTLPPDLGQNFSPKATQHFCRTAAFQFIYIFKCMSELELVHERKACLLNPQTLIKFYKT